VLPTIQRLTGGGSLADRPFDAGLRDVLIEALFASGSNLLLLPVQDVFGWRDRINEPALVSDANWSFRLPWPCDRMDDEPEARERQLMLRTWAERHGRR
jgi:4-alpha-glucanotransferase